MENNDGMEDVSGATLLTAPDERAQQPETDGAGKKEQQTEPEAEPAGEAKPSEPDDPSLSVPETPEGYDLQFGADTEVDKAMLGEFTKTAHELGITKAQAQKLAGMYESRVKAAVAEQQQRTMEYQRTALEKMESEIKNSPTFNEDRARARAVLRKYGDKELNQILDQTFIGSHPRFFKFVSDIGKTLEEPVFTGEGYGGKKEEPLEKRLWPNM